MSRSWNALMLEVSNTISELSQGVGLANGAAEAAGMAADSAREAGEEAREAAAEAVEAAQRAQAASALWDGDVSAALEVSAAKEEGVRIETNEAGAKHFGYTIHPAAKGDKGEKGDTGESGVTFELRDGTKLYITTKQA